MVTKVHLRKYPRKNITKVFLITRKHFLSPPAKTTTTKSHSCRNRWKFVEKNGVPTLPPKKNLENRSKILLKKPLTENSNSSVCGGGWGMTRCINVCNAFAFPCLWAVIPYTPTSSEHVETQSTDMSPPPRCCIDFAFQDWVFKSIFTVSCGHRFRLK